LLTFGFLENFGTWSQFPGRGANARVSPLRTPMGTCTSRGTFAYLKGCIWG